MSDHHQQQRFKPDGAIGRWLNQTAPSTLLIWCAVFLVIASVCAIVRVQIQSGLSWNEAQGFLGSGQDRLLIPSQYDHANDRSGLVFFKDAIALLLGIGAFIFGIIGGLLPMWAVGRLIADAIREGHRPGSDS